MTNPEQARPQQAGRSTTRRTVVAAVGAAGLAAALAACSDDGGSKKSDGADRPSGGESAGKPGGDGGGTGGGSQEPGGAESGTELARTADIPVGGGKVFPDRMVVVTQPVKGTFTAFSAKCTHRGCTVSEVSDGTINCPCHQSAFDIGDGSVTSGPAPSPLPRAKVAVEGGSIRLI
ncbi:Rieske (2Fe-2S) protein [Streptomyces albus subsp. albus]|nr:Rieske (2Fe-2S) protein [Streptomyces albus subsp. albus]